MSTGQPKWLTTATGWLGRSVLRGEMTEAEGSAALASEITRHPEYIEALVAAEISRDLDAWIAEHRRPAEADADALAT